MGKQRTLKYLSSCLGAVAFTAIGCQFPVAPNQVLRVPESQSRVTVRGQDPIAGLLPNAMTSPEPAPMWLIGTASLQMSSHSGWT